MENLLRHYANITELAGSIRQGELSCHQLVEHCLARIAALDKKLNAFRLVCGKKALEQARAADRALRAGKDLGPLHGIPYAVKDLFDVEGLPTTAGASLLADNIASTDAGAVRRLARAGMILLGKTNTVQFAYSGVGINHDHGTPQNPWSPVPHIPGGSSSGSAVAVAAGMVPVALGTDTGGSVRIPAALCATVGLKTTVGRISRAGVYPLSWSLDSVGALGRSVEDAARIYQCLQGVDANDDSTWGLARQDVMKNLKAGVRGMRLAFAESVFWENVHPEVEKTVRDCGRIFEQLGARVSRIDFPEAEAARQLNASGLIIAAEAYRLNRQWLEEYFDRLDPVVAQRMIKGREIAIDAYLQNIIAWKQLRVRAVNALKNVDALLVPATAIPALPMADVDADLDTYYARNLIYLRNTSIGNILNLCGLSLPCGFTQAGLPIGLMIYAKPFRENDLLRVGYTFQQATDWHKIHPDLSWAAGGKQ